MFENVAVASITSATSAAPTLDNDCHGGPGPKI